MYEDKKSTVRENHKVDKSHCITETANLKSSKIFDNTLGNKTIWKRLCLE